MKSVYKTFKTGFFLIVATSFCLMGNTVLAQSSNNYQLTGTILQLDDKRINVGDLDFKISPTVKVFIPGKEKAGLNNLRKGDYVGVKMIVFNGTQMVDSIYYLTNSPSNE